MSPTGPPAADTPQARRIFTWLIAALVLWGIYLAIGATGVFTDVGLFDIRRSLIVLACSAAFLIFWLVILRYRGAGSASTVNWSSIGSLLISLTAFVSWAIAHLVWNQGDGDRLTTSLGWISLGLFGSSAVMALIGVSDPRPSRGKLLGLLTLLSLLVAIALFVWQVQRFVSRPGRATSVRPVSEWWGDAADSRSPVRPLT